MTALGSLLTEAQPGFACGKEDGDGILQFRMHNVSKTGDVVLDKRRRIPLDSHRRIEYFHLRPGDVLFNSTNSPDCVGKSIIVPVLDEPAVFSNHFLRLRPDVNRLESRYLWRWLQFQFQRGVFQGMTRQWVNQATVGREDLLALDLPLPPPSEQRRIAAILDQADTLRAKRRQVLGRLEMLAPSVFRSMFQIGATVEWIKLGQVGEWRSGGTPPRSKPEYFEGTIPWFSSGELGALYVTEAREQISDHALAATAVKPVPAGSILVGMYDTAALKSSIVTVEASCNQAVAFASIDTKIADPIFVYFAIQNARTRVLALRRGIRQKNLNLTMIRSVEIQRVPLDEQRLFADRVGRINRQHCVVRRAAAAEDEVFRSLQSRAFRSEL